VAPPPLAKLTGSLKIVHVWEVQDPHYFPRTIDAAVGAYFSGERCQSLVEPSGFTIYSEPLELHAVPCRRRTA
jgi:hypothetical protein